MVTRTARWTLALSLTLGFAALAGCGRQPTGRAPASGEAAGAKQVVNVLVPCGQVGPFSQVIKLFEKAHPEIAIEWAQENMVTMTKKVLDGKATPDVFLSMGDLEMDKLEQAGKLLAGTRQAYAPNSLALIVPAKNPGKVNTIQDLANPEVKAIAMPNPEVNSSGAHARQAFQKAGLWPKIERKILLPRFGADTKDLAVQGKVEVAIAYYPCSVEVHVPGAPPNLPKDLKLIGHIPSDLYPPFSVEGAVLKGAKNPEGGKVLLEFLHTPEAQQVFREWEFVRESPSPEPRTPG